MKGTQQNSLLASIEASISMANSTANKLQTVNRRSRASTIQVTQSQKLKATGDRNFNLATKSIDTGSTIQAAALSSSRAPKKIALYRDRQPIIGLRKRHFPANIQTKHQNYMFDLDDFNPEERPLDEPILEVCPLCKRSFSYDIFQGHVQNTCKKVFLSRLKVFDSQY